MNSLFIINELHPKLPSGYPPYSLLCISVSWTADHFLQYIPCGERSSAAIRVKDPTGREVWRGYLGTRYWLLIRFFSNYLGIGKEFALQLAREGFNIILLARRRSKLEEVKAEIQREIPSAQVKIIVADLVSEGKKDKFADVLSELDSLKGISIVVNNAGVDVLEPFTDLSTEKIIDLISINCFALAAICHKFIPLFSERLRKEGKKSAIINVGSVAG